VPCGKKSGGMTLITRTYDTYICVCTRLHFVLGECVGVCGSTRLREERLVPCEKRTIYKMVVNICIPSWLCKGGAYYLFSFHVYILFN